MHRKKPVSESYFNKVANLMPANVLKEASTQVFSCEFFGNFKTRSSTEYLRRLLLVIIYLHWKLTDWFFCDGIIGHLWVNNIRLSFLLGNICFFLFSFNVDIYNFSNWPEQFYCSYELIKWTWFTFQNITLRLSILYVMPWALPIHYIH